MLSPQDYHCPDCGAEPGKPCQFEVGTMHASHAAHQGNSWTITFDDASNSRVSVHCIDRDSRDRLARELSSAGMGSVTTQDLMVRRKNLLGSWFIEAIDTPLHLSPASETYHSM